MSEGACLFYSDISYFVQSIFTIITLSLRFWENMRMSLPKVCRKVLLAAWKTKLLFKFWMENRLYYSKESTQKCASSKSCHSFQFVAISNSAIINESVNTAQFISYLHVFIIIRGLASRASRTLDWTRTLAFWAASEFWPGFENHCCSGSVKTEWAQGRQESRGVRYISFAILS